MTDARTIRIKEVRDEINNISPSFCAAKWKQVTLHLQNGHTHSCHHPATHIVPLDELVENPSALHNTTYKKNIRQAMLDGIRPKECSYCWRSEDSGTLLSDRVLKSGETWARPYIPDIVSKPATDDVFPSYVEVSFSNVCNFKCSYCSPNVSSAWMEEIQQYGGYPTKSKFNDIEGFVVTKKIPYLAREHNPYVEAFWQWWPELYARLEEFRITGGEPLLSKDTFRVLDYVIENPNPRLKLSINTNLNAPDGLNDKLIERFKRIQELGAVKELQLFTSCEAVGAQAEYIRYGMNYSAWLENLDRMLTELPDVHVTVMSTYNILSLTTYDRFLADIYAMKKKHEATTRKNKRQPLLIDIPFLYRPEHQAPYIFGEEFIHYASSSLEYMTENALKVPGNISGFLPHEIDGMRRVVNMMNDSTKKDYLAARQDLVRFVDEHDRRRGTNFLETFPEYQGIYKYTKHTL
jgi:organic radical activating enzyme